MKVAVNVADLTELDTLAGINIGAMLVDTVVPNRITVDADPKVVDGSALVLECDLERAEAIVGTLRIKANKVRAYKSTDGEGWRPL